MLNHQAGLANAGLQEISRDPFIVCDSDLILSIMAQSTPEHAPGAQTNYHYLTFGWLVEGLVKSITGGTLKEFVNTNIAIQQNIQSEFMIGIGSSSNTGEQEQMHADRLPTTKLSNEHEVSDRVANLVLGRIVMPPKPAVVASSATSTATTGTAVATGTATATAVAATNAAAAAAATATATTSNTVHSTNAAAPHAAVETEVASKSVTALKEVTAPSPDSSLKQISLPAEGKIHVRIIRTRSTYLLTSNPHPVTYEGVK